MTSFLGELGSKLADRWMSLLVLPGLLYVAIIAAAGLLGQRHAIDYVRVEHKIGNVAASSASHSTGALVLVAACVLAGSAAAGLAASLVGRCVELAWTAPGRYWPVRLLTGWRRRRWKRASQRELDSIRDAALAAYPLRGEEPSRKQRFSAQSGRMTGHPRDAPSRAAPDAGSAIARRERIGLVEPDRPTWIGDRLRAADQRVLKAYQLELASAWPALWLIVPDTTRNELGAAQEAYSAAARLTGWGLLYIIIGVWWWPALLIGAATTGAGWLHGRRATSMLAQLVEVTVDLFGRSLADQLGVPNQPPAGGRETLDRTTGSAITERLRKDPYTGGASGQPVSEQGSAEGGKST